MKKKIPKKITLDNLEKSAIKYLEKYSASEYQLVNILKRKIIKTCFFYKVKPETNFEFIKLITTKFKKKGFIDDKKFTENKIFTYMERGYSKKKIIFNLKTRGISDENIEEGINNLKTTYPPGFEVEVVNTDALKLFSSPNSLLIAVGNSSPVLTTSCNLKFVLEIRFSNSKGSPLFVLPS